MDYEITVNIPTAGDTSVLIVGVGEVKNGSTVKVDAEAARTFKNLTGITLGRANFQDGVTAKTVRGSGKPGDDDADDEKPVAVAAETKGAK